MEKKKNDPPFLSPQALRLVEVLSELNAAIESLSSDGQPAADAEIARQLFQRCCLSSSTKGPIHFDPYLLDTFSEEDVHRYATELKKNGGSAKAAIASWMANQPCIDAIRLATALQFPGIETKLFESTTQRYKGTRNSISDLIKSGKNSLEKDLFALTKDQEWSSMIAWGAKTASVSKQNFLSKDWTLLSIKN